MYPPDRMPDGKKTVHTISVIYPHLILYHRVARSPPCRTRCASYMGSTWKSLAAHARKGSRHSDTSHDGHLPIPPPPTHRTQHPLAQSHRIPTAAAGLPGLPPQQTNSFYSSFLLSIECPHSPSTAIIHVHYTS